MSVIERDKYGLYMVLIYLFSKILNIFIENNNIIYISNILLIIICLLISLKINKIYKGERLIYIGLVFLLFSLDIPYMLSLIIGFLGVVFIFTGGIYRYRRLGSIYQFYHWKK